MAATVDIEGDVLVAELHGAHKLWALKSRLEIPLANVIGAESGEKEASEWRNGLRLAGTHIPGAIAAGRFYSEGKLVFWDVRDARKAVAIKLRDEHFDRLVLEVDEPEAVIAKIRDAVSSLPRR